MIVDDSEMNIFIINKMIKKLPILIKNKVKIIEASNG